MNQLELHNKISKTLSGGPDTIVPDDVDILLINADAREYFFTNADGRWLKWLWENGLMVAIKNPVSQSDTRRYWMPELQYLYKVAETEPATVSEIICSLEINQTRFNPEVLDRFVSISSKLPARHLKKIVKKMKEEQWIKLLGDSRQSGFIYADMVKVLQEAHDYKSILGLAESLLLIKPKKERNSYNDDNPFYVEYISETNIFSSLINLPDKYIEDALSISMKSFKEMIVTDNDYTFLDIDLFTLRLSELSRDEFHGEHKYLAATAVELSKRLFNDKGRDVKKLFNKYFNRLPQKRIAQRLKLFVLSLSPKLFTNELKDEYFRLFEVEKIYDVLYGAEYERSLKAGFRFLENNDQRKYVESVFNLFIDVRKDEDANWNKHYASCILSTIADYLTDEEVSIAESKGYKIDPSYEPEPTFVSPRSGSVVSRSPIDLENYSIPEVAEKLKNDLSPDELQKKYRNDDPSRPRDIDGVAQNLKHDIKGRLNDYLENATLFFDREILVPHYTNSYLRGVNEALEEKRSELRDLDFSELFNLLKSISMSGIENSFNLSQPDNSSRWLSNWNSVHSSISDLLEELLKEVDSKMLLNFEEYREQILNILEYLFSYLDPIPEDEKLKSAKMTIKQAGESEYSISDPFSIAINSVRGRTYQTWLHFIYQDSKNSTNDKLASDVKKLFDEVLRNEKTRALMFMFGHHLPTFYFRDKTWTRSKFNEIFVAKDKDKYLHLAAWEGYLSQNLYKELFLEDSIQKLYSCNITSELKYPNQDFFRNPHESIAAHFALAFIHYEEFGIENDLFKEFLDKADDKQLSEFISLLGRSYVAGKNSSILLDENYPWRIDRLREFWDIALDNHPQPLALKEFGTWIDVEHNVFDKVWLAEHLSQTLDCTKGKLVWDYGLKKSIETLAKDAPESTLDILEKYFLGNLDDPRNMFPIRSEKEWYHAFEILYNNSDKKYQKATYDLINTLIEKGGREFWSLEDIVRKEN